MNTRPKATGCIVTYNNADKIEKVVASILEQDTARKGNAGILRQEHLRDRLDCGISRQLVFLCGL